jgi:hypothetical protein
MNNPIVQALVAIVIITILVAGAGAVLAMIWFRFQKPHPHFPVSGHNGLTVDTLDIPEDRDFEDLEVGTVPARRGPPRGPSDKCPDDPNHFYRHLGSNHRDY